MITTTLRKIREHYPFGCDWKKLIKSLGGIKNHGLDTPIRFSRIVKINGVVDAYWCLRSVCPEHEKEVRSLLTDVAERVLHLYEKEYQHDSSTIEAIKAVRDFSNGLISEEELSDACDFAWDAIGDAARDAERNIQSKLLIERFG